MSRFLSAARPGLSIPRILCCLKSRGPLALVHFSHFKWGAALRHGSLVTHFWYVLRFSYISSGDLTYFQKNVYSVFRFNPPSVGFAQLSPFAQSFARTGDPLPTPTIGENPALPTGNLASSASPVSSLYDQWRTLRFIFIIGAMLGVMG